MGWFWDTRGYYNGSHELRELAQDDATKIYRPRDGNYGRIDATTIDMAWQFWFDEQRPPLQWVAGHKLVRQGEQDAD